MPLNTYIPTDWSAIEAGAAATHSRYPWLTRSAEQAMLDTIRAKDEIGMADAMLGPAASAIDLHPAGAMFTRFAAPLMSGKIREAARFLENPANVVGGPVVASIPALAGRSPADIDKFLEGLTKEESLVASRLERTFREGGEVAENFRNGVFEGVYANLPEILAAENPAAAAQLRFTRAEADAVRRAGRNPIETTLDAPVRSAEEGAESVMSRGDTVADATPSIEQTLSSASEPATAAQQALSAWQPLRSEMKFSSGLRATILDDYFQLAPQLGAGDPKLRARAETALIKKYGLRNRDQLHKILSGAREEYLRMAQSRTAGTPYTTDIQRAIPNYRRAGLGKLERDIVIGMDIHGESFGSMSKKLGKSITPEGVKFIYDRAIKKLQP